MNDINEAAEALISAIERIPEQIGKLGHAFAALGQAVVGGLEACEWPRARTTKAERRAAKRQQAAARRKGRGTNSGVAQTARQERSRANGGIGSDTGLPAADPAAPYPIWTRASVGYTSGAVGVSGRPASSTFTRSGRP